MDPTAHSARCSSRWEKGPLPSDHRGHHSSSSIAGMLLLQKATLLLVNGPEPGCTKHTLHNGDTKQRPNSPKGSSPPPLPRRRRHHCCSTIRDADPRCIHREFRKKCPASVFHFLHLAFWFDPGCWDQKQQLHAAAARRGGRNEPRHRRHYCS